MRKTNTAKKCGLLVIPFLIASPLWASDRGGVSTATDKGYSSPAGEDTARIQESASPKGGDFEAKMDQATTEEFQLAKAEVDKDLSKAQAKLADIEKSKEHVIAKLAALAVTEEKGATFFDRYIQLIKVRYIDKAGLFDPYMELTAKDVNNINVIFTNYLHSSPLEPKTSSGIALVQLTQGLASLKLQISTHKTPAAENNSELGILKQEQTQALERVKVVQGLLAKFELPFLKDARMPASTGSNASETPSASTPLQVAPPTAVN